jgi:hypothetical protein
MPAVTLSAANNYNGYSAIRIQIDIPQNTVAPSGTNNLNIITPCAVNIPNLGCTIHSYNPTFRAYLTYTGTEQITINYL